MSPSVARSKALLACLTVACGLASGCPAPEGDDLEHGFINIEFKRGQSEMSSPYDGTATIEVTLLYLQCLTSFYEANPDYRQFGLEGALVFGTLEDGGEGWTDRLCEDRPAQVDCEVTSFRQELDSARQLTISYDVTGPVEDLLLPFGPLPTEELAACDGFDQPIVRVANQGAVRGLDANGNTVWNTETFDPPEAATGQGAPIQIRAARPN